MKRIVAVAVACLTAGACKPNEPTVKVGDTTFASNEASGTATITTPQGSITAAEGTAAAQVAMPDYAPAYPGATVETSLVSRADGVTTTTLILNTTDPIDKVISFYRAKFTAAGLEVLGEMTAPDSATLAGQKGEQRASIMTTREDPNSTILITIGR